LPKEKKCFKIYRDDYKIMSKRSFNRKIFQAKKSWLFLFLSTIISGFLIILIGFIVLFSFYAKDLPRPEKFTEKQFTQSTKIYDRTGDVLLYEIYGEEKRTLVPISLIPEYLKQAVIATEDADFYNHPGVDMKAMAMSILANIKVMQPTAYGASTINQQLIRSVYFSPEKTMSRKFKEIVLSLELNRRYSKDQILEWYLNQVPFGSNCYGVETASQTYFKKSVSDISLEEAAVLASLIQAPSRLSPYGNNKDELLKRKDYVLDRMVKNNFIDTAKAEETKKKEITFVKISQSIKAPHFTLWIKQQLEEMYGEDFLREKGLKIYTSMDWDIQQIVEEELKAGTIKNKAYNANNATFVAINPKTGEVLALTGSTDYFGDPVPAGCDPGKNCLFDPQYNVAIGTPNNPGRQPGSTFKPFAYVTAFKNGYSDKTIVADAPTSFGVWGNQEYAPQNYDRLFRGDVTLRQALSQSLNIPAIKTLLYLAGGTPKEGIENTIKTAQDLGITTLKPPFGPAIVLGGWEAKLLEMVSAYGGFATEGMITPPVSILKIENEQGDIIFENKKEPKRVLSVEPCRILNDILSDNVARTPMFGANSSLYFKDYQVAVKTGTSEDYRDAWTIGYTPSLVGGIWVGNNNNKEMVKKASAMISSPMWHSIMEKILGKMPKETFTKPSSN